MALIVTIVFGIMPIISIPLIFIGIAVDKKHNFIYGILLAIMLALVAYNFNPTSKHDLYRYYYEMENYFSMISFDRFVSKNMFSNTKFLFIIIQFIISQIGNFRLLPFIITLVGYSITFCVILDYANIKKISNKSKLFILISFMLIFYHINFISGLSQYLSIIVSFLGFYLEYIKGHKNIFTKLLYVIACLIHISAIIMLAFRILLCFKFKKSKYAYIIFLIIYTFGPTLIYNIISMVPNLTAIANKISSYMLTQENGFNSLYNIANLFLIFIFAIVFYVMKNKLITNENKKFYDLLEVIILFNIASIPYIDVFLRIINFTLLGMFFYFIDYFASEKTDKKVLMYMILLIFAIAFGSVNTNNFATMNLNNDFSNIFGNIFYFLKQ